MICSYSSLYLVHCNDHDGVWKNGDIVLDRYVEVYVGKEFIPICWEKDTRNGIANTVCRQLGFDGAKMTSSKRLF